MDIIHIAHMYCPYYGLHIEFLTAMRLDIFGEELAATISRRWRDG